MFSLNTSGKVKSVVLKNLERQHISSLITNVFKNHLQYGGNKELRLSDKLVDTVMVIVSIYIYSSAYLYTSTNSYVCTQYGANTHKYIYIYIYTRCV